MVNGVDMNNPKQFSAVEKAAIISRYQSERSFWQQRLSINPVVSQFPKVAINGEHGYKETGFDFSPLVSQKLQQLTGGIEQRVLVALLTVMSIELSRYTGQEAVNLGADIFDAGHSCLPLVIEMERSSSFKEALLSTKHAYSQVLENKNYPFDLIQSDILELGTARDGSLFNVAVILNSGNKTGITSQNKNYMAWNFEFSGEDQLSVTVGFDGSVYDTLFVTQLINHFQNLLEGLLVETDSSAFSYKLLSNEEADNLLGPLAGEKTDYPRDGLIQQVFQEQVRLSPQQTAIVHNGVAISYQALDQQSTDLAVYLTREEGIKPGDRVALLLEKSPEVIVSILAILKCGAIYAPLDTNTPAKRLEKILDILAPELVITDSAFMFELNDIDAKMFIYDIQIDAVPPADSEVVFDRNDNNLVYIMFTSGTTGEPKGVQVTHHGVIRLVKNTNYVSFEPGSRVLLASSLAFDASTFELWGMLLNGGTVYLESKESLLNFRLLKDALHKNDITHMWFTSAWFNQLVDYDPEVFSKLRYLLAGGDVLSPRHINIVRNHCPNVVVINGYGPTENTTFSTYYKIEQNDLASIPLGKPVANSTVYILDPDSALLPVGAWGEIVVGGDGVAHGYWNNETETAKKFITKNWGDHSSARLYRTGDVGRMLPDGVIEFGGRIDKQVKIRGFRIELNEIEIALNQISGVSESRVVVRSSEDDKYLVAYVVPRNAVKEEDIHAGLLAVLPDYMIPRYIQLLAEFPLTANGKIDQSKLPEPELALSSTLSQPGTDSEKYVVDVWAHLLDVDKNSIGLESNFFEIGGHSLKATLFIAQVHKDLGAVITLNDVFQSADLKTIAHIVSKAKRNSYASIPTADQKAFYPASSTQRRMYMIQNMRPTATTYNIPMVFSWKGILDRARLQQSLDQVIAKHDGLRTSFHMHDGEIVQKINPDASIKITYVKRDNENPDAQIYKYIESFDLAEAPLFKVTIFEERPDEYLVLVNIHHIVFDAVSLDLFVNDWSKAYCGESLDKAGIRYVDFSEWLDTDAGVTQLLEHEQYWMDQFRELPPVLKLPVTKSRPPIQTFEGETISFELGDEISNKLKGIATENGSTLFMVMLAVVNVWLHKITGQDDITIGSPVAGRSHSELAEVIGMFVNTLPLRNHIDGNTRFVDFLANVKNVCLDGFDHQAYPFEKIVENVVKDKDLSRNPLFDVMFALQNAETKWPDFGGSEISPFYLDTRTAKFDINIAAYEYDNKLNISFEYNSYLFSRHRAEMLINSLLAVVQSITAHSESTISEFQALTDEQRLQLIAMGTGPKEAFSVSDAMHLHVFSHAVNRPDSIAVSCRDESLSYHELNTRSNQLAHVLVQNGHTGNEVVAIQLDRGNDLIVAIVAIQKVAGAFLVIDPSLPVERGNYMLRDSGARILITGDGQKSELAADHYVDLDSVADAPISNYVIDHKSTDIAYIIYTSGSTGRPKGVKVSFASLSNFVMGMDNAYNNSFSDNDIFFSNAKSVFDAFVSETIIPLWFGGHLVINPSEDVLDFNRVADLIVEKSISFCYLPLLLVKPVFKKIIDDQRPTQLNKMFFGAEPIKDDILKECRLLNPDMQVLNAYGPTENTVCASLYDCTGHKVSGEYLPIGKPMANVDLFIVDDSGHLAPEGVVGELFISGNSLATGYTDEQETQQKFIQWQQGNGQRVYRTGDLCRWNESGDLIFVGRRDSQIKLRGVRIEPAEIEYVLGEHELVGEVVVQVKYLSNQEDPSLIAYYRADSVISVDELRRWCKRRIPAYMVPDFFVHLVNPPMNLSGKIDRKRLPDPEVQYVDDFVAASTPVQIELVELWSQALGIKSNEISIERSFFDMGGNSLKILNLWRALNDKYHADIKVVDLFSLPTIAEFSDKLGSLTKTNEKEIADFSL